MSNLFDGSLFEKAKTSSTMSEVVSRYTDGAVIGCGNWLEPATKECPFCQAHDAFRIEPEDTRFYCFSCDESGDCIDFVAKLNNQSLVEAANNILEVGASTHHEKQMRPRKKPQEVLSPEKIDLKDLQQARVLEAVAAYYHDVYRHNLDAQMYQQEYRFHKPEAIEKLELGYTDGKMGIALMAQGFSKFELINAGVLNKGGYDFYPSGCFVYPHRIEDGSVGHISMKPHKDKDMDLFQLNKASRQSRYAFYGQSSLVNFPGSIFIVEGENDVASLLDIGWSEGLLGCNGNISSQQIEYLRYLPQRYSAAGKATPKFITCFDNDAAGDKYRGKVGKELAGFDVIQLLAPSSVKDIDEAIHKEILKNTEGVLQLERWITPIESEAAKLTDSVGRQPLKSDSNADFSVDLINQLMTMGYRKDAPVTLEIYSDLMLADDLHANLSGGVHYIKERSQFMLWSEACWLMDAENQVKHHLRPLLQSLKSRAESILSMGKDGDNKEAKAIIQQIKRGESNAGQNSVIGLLKTIPKVELSVNDLDADVTVIGFKNGYLDLKDFTFHEPDKTRLITKSMNVIYEPDATCPVFLNFLDNAFSAPKGYEAQGVTLTPEEQQADKLEMVEYVQKVLGRSLMGNTNLKELYVMIGRKDTGKSVLTNAILSVMGDYGLSISSKSLLEGSVSGDCMNPDIAKVPGKRFVLASESPVGKKYDEELVKNLISAGDEVTVRTLREKPISFVSQASMFITANTNPTLTNCSQALLNRFVLIPFLNVVERHQQDMNLSTKLRGEAAGIANWLIEGARKGGAEGFAKPKRVLLYSDKFKDSEDAFAEFYGECMQAESGAFCSKNEVYKAYKDWAISNGMQPMQVKRFAPKMEEMGHYQKKKRIYSTGNPVACFMDCIIQGGHITGPVNIDDFSMSDTKEDDSIEWD